MVRILTYNVHRWLGTDRKIQPERTADVIASCEPDIVALQEVRAGRVSKGQVDQAVMVAKRLGMELHFQPTIRVLGEQYGIAVLTRHPSRLVRSDRLPSLSPGPAFEKRSALWVSIEIGGRSVQVVNAHLSLRSRERLAQADALCGAEWIGHRECLDPAILLGDFNAPPRSRSYRLMASRLLDAQLWNPAGEPQATFHTRAPLLRLDHIFVSRSIDVVSAGPVRTRLSKVASDHFPLMAHFSVSEPRTEPAEAPSEAPSEAPAASAGEGVLR